MQNMIWRDSIRISRSRGSASKRRKILEYLALLALKNNIEARELLNCILEAWNKQQSECKQLTIKCRHRTKDSANFLFIGGREVLAQFPIPIQILQGKKELEGYMNIVHIKPRSDEEMSSRINGLKPGMRKVNLKARVLEIPEPNQVYTRHGTVASVTNVLIGDETGTIRMNLWNQQINMVSEGDLIQIDNGTVARFRGERQIRIGKHGKITVIQDANSLIG